MTADSLRATERASPKVSVCVITYNQEQYIGECLQSLVEQRTNFDFEIIVGDDCSTDGTHGIILDFARRYPHLIRTNFQPYNTGGSKNNLEVHAAARGDYVAHIDGDDYALPGRLQAQADVLDTDHGCNAVWHLVDFFDDLGGFCSGDTADLSMFPMGKVSFDNAIRLGYVGVYSSLMYRRSALTPIETDRNILDLYFTWDTLSKGHGMILNKVFGRYRVASTGSLQAKSSSRVRDVGIEHAYEFLTRHLEHRRDFMIWALTSALISITSRHGGAFDYLRLAWRARTWIGLTEVGSNLLNMRRARVKWPEERRLQDKGLLKC
jgi:glycosyltransferase involved in cell wall biosynthesis